MNFGTGLAIVAAVLWGASYTLASKVLSGTTPLFYLVIASALRLLWFSLLFATTRTEWSAASLNAKALPLICAETLFSAAATFCIMTAITKIGAGRASLLEITYPVFVILFSRIFFGQQVSSVTVLGGLVVLAGVAIIASEH